MIPNDLLLDASLIPLATWAKLNWTRLVMGYLT